MSERHREPVRLFLVAVVSLGMAGCNGAARSPVGDPWPIVRSLMDRNPVAHKYVYAKRCEGESRSSWTLSYFPGGLAVGWGGWDKIDGWLLFRNDGMFLCFAIRYIPIDVTGDGVRDLVTTEMVGNGFGFFVHDLAHPEVPPVFLGSMIKYSLSEEAFPAVWDADGDGTFEVICCGPTYDQRPYYGLPEDCGLDMAALEAEEIDWVVTVWSLRRGIPRIVLALSTMDEYEYSFHNPLFSGLSIAGESVTWDATEGRFQVPVLKGVRVLINRGMLDG